MSLIFSILLALGCIASEPVSQAHRNVLLTRWIRWIDQVIVAPGIVYIPRSRRDTLCFTENSLVHSNNVHHVAAQPFMASRVFSRGMPLKVITWEYNIVRPIEVAGKEIVSYTIYLLNQLPGRSDRKKIRQVEGRCRTFVAELNQGPNKVSCKWRMSHIKIKADVDPSTHLGLNPIGRNLIGDLGLFQGEFGLTKRAQQESQTGKTQDGTYNAQVVGPGSRARRFFSGNSSAPLSAQIGAIMILSAVAAIGFYNGICGKPRIEWLRCITLCGSMGLLCLLVWLTSPLATYS